MDLPVLEELEGKIKQLTVELYRLREQKQDKQGSEQEGDKLNRIESKIKHLLDLLDRL